MYANRRNIEGVGINQRFGASILISMTQPQRQLLSLRDDGWLDFSKFLLLAFEFDVTDNFEYELSRLHHR